MSRRVKTLLHVVDDDVRVRIEQDQIGPDETVFEFLGQLRQPFEHLRRDRRERDLSG